MFDRKYLISASLAATMFVASVGVPAAAQASSYGEARYGPSYQVPPGIGHWKAKRDRAELRRYRGDPASQAILRQKRHNLCRNVPEVC